MSFVCPVLCVWLYNTLSSHPLEKTAARLTLNAVGCLGEKWPLGERVEGAFIHGLKVGKDEFGLGEAASALQSTSPQEKFSSPNQGLLAPCRVR